MRFYTGQHRYYCGIDLHVRMMYLCVLDQAGNVLSAPQHEGVPRVVSPRCRPVSR